MRIKDIITEAPIGDYKTIGDFSKSYSFRDKRDRTLATEPKIVERTKKKFGNTPYTLNFYMVNTKNAKNVPSDYGLATYEWVQRVLGDEVANEMKEYASNDAINVIFTGNSAGEKVVLTPWILAHRMAHALSRYNNSYGRNSRQFQTYQNAADALAETSMNIFTDCYSVRNFPKNDNQLSTRDNNNRRNQLLYKHFFTKVCTFRSAREDSLRDWFEVLNELFAQWVITGDIKFNQAPASFGTKGAFGSGTGMYYCTDQESADDYLHSLRNTLLYYFDDLMGEATNQILVM